MRPSTRHLLTNVAARYPCVVISGRRLDDLAKRLQRVPIWHLLGDHGFESRGTPKGASAQVRGWVAQLRTPPAQKGLVIEAKRHSITVHYRHVRDKRRVLELLAEAAHQLRDARAIYSPEAINFSQTMALIRDWRSSEPAGRLRATLPSTSAMTTPTRMHSPRPDPSAFCRSASGRSVRQSRIPSQESIRHRPSDEAAGRSAQDEASRSQLDAISVLWST